MEQPLLPDVDDLVENLGLNDLDASVKCCGPCAAVLFLLMACMIGVVEVNHVGIKSNSLTGSVDPDDVYKSGLYFVGPFTKFITFPSTLITVDFSSHAGADRPPVQARTGADPLDPDSGGQPISISISFQYRFNPSKVGTCYLDFGSRAATHARFLQLAFNKISTLAQIFNPADFWTSRDVIAVKLHRGLNETLWHDADQGATVEFLQILRVDFAERYENTITEIQVAEQQKVVNEYKQKVQEVIQQIADMNASNQAEIANVTANGDATAALIIASANQEGFRLKQQAKGKAYKRFMMALSFTETQMIRYFQIKSLQQQSKVTVGIPEPTKVP